MRMETLRKGKSNTPWPSVFVVVAYVDIMSWGVSMSYRHYFACPFHDIYGSIFPSAHTFLESERGLCIVLLGTKTDILIQCTGDHVTSLALSGTAGSDLTHGKCTHVCKHLTKNQDISHVARS